MQEVNRHINYRFNDQPAAVDAFGFDVIARSLAGIIATRPKEDTPLTIGVYGPWGSGKSSLMQMLQDQLGKQAQPAGTRAHELEPPAIGTVCVWFNAWRYARHEQALWRSLLICIVETIRDQLLGKDGQTREWLTRFAAYERRRSPNGAERTVEQVRADLETNLDDLIDSLYRTVDREELGRLELDWSKAGAASMRALLRIGLSAVPAGGAMADLVEKAAAASAAEFGKGADLEHLFGVLRRERATVYRDQIQSLEQFHNQFKKLIATWFTGHSALPNRLVIFVDDLDRCLPEDCVGVLEAIKVFFDVPGCVVVLGIDHDVVAQGIRHHYRELLNHHNGIPLEGRDYLEKIVQIPIYVPLLRQEDMTPFLRERMDWLTDADGRIDEAARHDVVEALYNGLPHNPRVCKRALNMLVVLDRLAREIEGASPFSRPLMAKLVVLRYRYPRLYDYLAREPDRLLELERKARGSARNADLGDFAEHLYSGDRVNKSAQISAADPQLTRMLINGPLFETQSSSALSQLLFLTSLLRSQP